MAAATAPVFVDTPKSWIGSLATANTNRDGSGTIVTIASAAADGTKIEHIDIQAYGTTTTGAVRLYVHDGSTAHLWREILVTDITPSTTVAAWSRSIDCSLPSNLLVMQTGYSLRASTHNSENFRVIAFGGDF